MGEEEYLVFVMFTDWWFTVMTVIFVLVFFTPSAFVSVVMVKLKLLPVLEGAARYTESWSQYKVFLFILYTAYQLSFCLSTYLLFFSQLHPPILFSCLLFFMWNWFIWNLKGNLIVCRNLHGCNFENFSVIFKVVPPGMWSEPCAYLAHCLHRCSDLLGHDRQPSR